MMKTIALLSVLLFSVWNHGLLWMSSKFISSKPPGRRMVTSNLNILLNCSLHAALLTFSLGLAIRITFGHLRFLICQDFALIARDQPRICSDWLDHDDVMDLDQLEQSLDIFLRFWTVFLIVEVGMKLSFMLVAGLANFSRLVQISLVHNHRWLQNYNDKESFGVKCRVAYFFKHFL